VRRRGRKPGSRAAGKKAVAERVRDTHLCSLPPGVDSTAPRKKFRSRSTASTEGRGPRDVSALRRHSGRDAPFRKSHANIERRARVSREGSRGGAPVPRVRRSTVTEVIDLNSPEPPDETPKEEDDRVAKAEAAQVKGEAESSGNRRAIGAERWTEQTASRGQGADLLGSAAAAERYVASPGGPSASRTAGRLARAGEERATQTEGSAMSARSAMGAVPNADMASIGGVGLLGADGRCPTTCYVMPQPESRQGICSAPMIPCMGPPTSMSHYPCYSGGGSFPPPPMTSYLDYYPPPSGQPIPPPPPPPPGAGVSPPLGIPVAPDRHKGRRPHAREGSGPGEIPRPYYAARGTRRF
ncbi:hypothetical protein FOZ62_032500, partial [Perkinsus olseni]